jgi:GNAT superfamily N-acetyltransferase
MLAITRVEAAADLAEARELFREYASTLDFGLDFQGFAEEVADLARAYPPPAAGILLAKWHGVAVGCVAIRPLDGSACELKRMYVRPRLRGLGIGRCLASVAREAAREMGYATMRLDTVPAMGAAIELYRSVGFAEIPPYRLNPVPGAIFMELDLGAAANARRKRPSPRQARRPRV